MAEVRQTAIRNRSGQWRIYKHWGLWDIAQVDGGSLLSVAIIAANGNELMAPVHDRMPVIIGEESLARWLGEEPATSEQIADLLKPFSASRMRA